MTIKVKKNITSKELLTTIYDALRINTHRELIYNAFVYYYNVDYIINYKPKIRVNAKEMKISYRETSNKKVNIVFAYINVLDRIILMETEGTFMNYFTMVDKDEI